MKAILAPSSMSVSPKSSGPTPGEHRRDVSRRDNAPGQNRVELHARQRTPVELKGWAGRIDLDRSCRLRRRKYKTRNDAGQREQGRQFDTAVPARRIAQQRARTARQSSARDRCRQGASAIFSGAGKIASPREPSGANSYPGCILISQRTNPVRDSLNPRVRVFKGRLVFTVDCIRKFHLWTHSCLTRMLDHLSTIPASDYSAEVPGFGFPTLREQVIHIFNCEGFWVHALQGLHYSRSESSSTAPPSLTPDIYSAMLASRPSHICPA